VIPALRTTTPGAAGRFPSSRFGLQRDRRGVTMADLAAADAVDHPNAGSLFNELSQNFRRAVTQV
jgi:hypothetical protein